MVFSTPSPTARLAQSVEHETLNLRVVGSSPTLGARLLFFTPQCIHTTVILFVFQFAGFVSRPLYISSLQPSIFFPNAARNNVRNGFNFGAKLNLLLSIVVVQRAVWQGGWYDARRGRSNPPEDIVVCRATFVESFLIYALRYL